MRSIRYLLGGRPHTMDDCLDFAGREPPSQVTLTLTTEDIVTEMHVLRQLIGLYTWLFPRGQVSCEDVCGGFRLDDDDWRRAERIARANRRVRRRLAALAERGISVRIAENRFSPAKAT